MQARNFTTANGHYWTYINPDGVRGPDGFAASVEVDTELDPATGTLTQESVQRVADAFRDQHRVSVAGFQLVAERAVQQDDGTFKAVIVFLPA